MMSSSNLIKASNNPAPPQPWAPAKFSPGVFNPGEESLPTAVPAQISGVAASQPSEAGRVSPPIIPGEPGFSQTALSPLPRPSGRPGDRVIKGMQPETDVHSWQPGALSPPFNHPAYSDLGPVYGGPHDPPGAWSNPYVDYLLADIKAQAGGILQQAREQAAQVVFLAQQDGYKHGQEAAREETASRLRAAEAIVQEMNTWQAAVLEQSERAVIELTKEIARTIFGPGVALDPEVLSKAFERVLREAKTLGNLRVHLHPDDLAALHPEWSRQQSAMTGQTIQLVPDPDITRGGCLINGDNGSVDARMETQLQLAFDALSGLLPDEPGEQR
jgi:flagellar biosynthesis/type III secretory pathway protein FliH